MFCAPLFLLVAGAGLFLLGFVQSNMLCHQFSVLDLRDFASPPIVCGLPSSSAGSVSVWICSQCRHQSGWLLQCQQRILMGTGFLDIAVHPSCVAAEHKRSTFRSTFPNHPATSGAAVSESAVTGGSAPTAGSRS